MLQGVLHPTVTVATVKYRVSSRCRGTSCFFHMSIVTTRTVNALHETWQVWLCMNPSNTMRFGSFMGRHRMTLSSVLDTRSTRSTRAEWIYGISRRACSANTGSPHTCSAVSSATCRRSRRLGHGRLHCSHAPPSLAPLWLTPPAMSSMDTRQNQRLSAASANGSPRESRAPSLCSRARPGIACA